MRTLEQEDYLIPKKRKQELLEVSSYISLKIKDKKTPAIIVICTHNSRRSHFGQLWLKVAAVYHGLSPLQVFSGGTEATAFHPNAVAALHHVGFKIEKTTEEENPVYEGEIGQEGKVLVMFSKRFDHENNAQKDFGALLVCTQADEACPVVTGADARFAIPYDDPKAFDDTEEMEEKYLDRCRQIAREMFYIIRHAQ